MAGPETFLAPGVSASVWRSNMSGADDFNATAVTFGGSDTFGPINSHFYQVSLEGVVLEALLAITVVSLCVTAVCVHRGWVGPLRLQPGDLRALTTFSDAYRIADLELEADVLSYEVENWCCIGKRISATCPILDWSEMFSGAPRGFLVDLAKGIDTELLAFQHRVWLSKGDFAAHLPTVLVAQEWRRWAMEELQHAVSPKEEHREAIRRRIKWINNIRDLSLLGVAQLRDTQCWDDSDSLSLLITFREHILPDLRKYHNNWSVFEMMQSFSAGAGDVVGFFTQTLRNTMRFLEKVFCTSELRMNPLQGKAKDMNNLVDRNVMEFIEYSGLFHSSFPENFRSKFFDPEQLKRLEEEVVNSASSPPSTFRTVRKHPEDMADVEKEHVRAMQKEYSSSQFGLQANEGEFIEMLRHYVVLLRHCYVLLDVVLLLTSIQSFARLGGTSLMADLVSKPHGQSVMSFAKTEVSEVKQNLVQIADIAQGGWSNFRRQSWQWRHSPWSNLSPLDNVRMSINLMDTVERTYENAIHKIGVLKAQIAKARGGGDSSRELSAEVQFYHKFWDLLVKKHSVPPDDVVYI
ncbi:unnamed protein product [Symbiodinium natans]|uniref:Uncharacterized protein n=1 Tax=Symbiodinium natans TaxID=878477 RepID=A0A812S050_9DINO|nr:unnamed protein product [Symbiodinium natans]